MEYAQYDQPPNQHYKVPHLQSAIPILPQNSSPQPYTYKQYPDQASRILPSPHENYQQLSSQYEPMGYPQYGVPGVGMPPPYSISLPQAAAMATAAASGIFNPYPYAMYPNTDTPQGVASRTIRAGHEHEAEGIQNADDRKFRRWTSHNAEESPLYVNAKQSHRKLKLPIARQKLGAHLERKMRGFYGDTYEDSRTLSETLPLTSQTMNKDLPIGINGQKLDASADTGSDECGMPKDIADRLGLKVRCAPSDIKEFEMGNGRKIKSIGRTTADCSFWNEPWKKLRCVFYVFETLIVPLIMGRDFLERTDTLTQHQDRLVDRPPRTGPCRVMHLNRPKRRMRCYIDSDLVKANPDTGAEMELVSPDFVKRKGYAVDASDAAHEEVQFVDGSTARTQGQVTMKFEAYGDAFEEAVPSKARYRTFYVLDGLTTDILLGEDLLYSIKAFTEHASSFVDLDDFGMPVELKGIVWLDRAEQRLARIFGGDLPGISATSALGTAGKRPIIRHFPRLNGHIFRLGDRLVETNRYRHTITNAKVHLPYWQSYRSQNSGRGPSRGS
jgi:hypothetical protein